MRVCVCAWGCLCVWGWRVQGLCWALGVTGEAGEGCVHVWGLWEEEVPLHLQKGSMVAARGTPSGLRVRVDSVSGNPGSHGSGSGVFLPEQLLLLDSGKDRGWESQGLMEAVGPSPVCPHPLDPGGWFQGKRLPRAGSSKGEDRWAGLQVTWALFPDYHVAGQSGQGADHRL